MSYGKRECSCEEEDDEVCWIMIVFISREGLINKKYAVFISKGGGVVYNKCVFCIGLKSNARGRVGIPVKRCRYT